ncbi:sodium:sulfate symporter [Billgrantia azerbaijanica]|nr:sodium:sulfate symporter [Halomonas azerbaijanica]
MADPVQVPTQQDRATASDRARASSTPAWRVIGVLVAAGSVGGLLSLHLPLPMAGTAALVIFCIGLWATAAVPEYWPALAFFLIATLFQLAPTETVFSGFHSSTFWLFFGGIVLGIAIRHTGLGQRIAQLLSSRLGDTYAGMILRITLAGLALAFIIPSSMARIFLLLPLIMALADRLGYHPGSNGRTGMLIAAVFGTWAPAFSILPSNAPNMILSGMAESLYGEQFSYGYYLILHFPVLGLLKAAAVALLALWMFPDRAPVATDTEARPAPSPMSGAERRLVGVLVACILLWLTDGLHGISPGWVGLGAALYCLLPASRLTPGKCINEQVNYGSLFFVAGIIGLGAVIAATGLGEAAIAWTGRHVAFAPDQPLGSALALTAISTLFAIVVSLPGVPAIMTPAAASLADATGLSLMAVLMTQVLAFSNVLLPYQAPPLLAALQMTQLPLAAMTKFCLALFAVGIVALVPLEMAWWFVLGLL